MSNQTIDRSVAAIGKILLGKERQIRLALACLFARGHLLIEDLPGLGKTTLAQALSQVLGLSYSRIQFTSDLLPADIIGVSVYDRNRAAFDFHPGPIFNQLILADEINRTTPKTQSALLEAMAEGQVTVEGETRQLPQPFFVIATQNPLMQSGTFPLPESQLDRFLMRIQVGYPDPLAEKRLLLEGDTRRQLQQVEAVMNTDQLQELQQQVDQVRASDALVSYLQKLVQYTRDKSRDYGISPRGALAVLQAAKAWALMAGREYVVPEDVQAVIEPVCSHRLPPLSSEAFTGAGRDSSGLIEQALQTVDIL